MMSFFNHMIPNFFNLNPHYRPLIHIALAGETLLIGALVNLKLKVRHG
jgi:hypothetical protein